MILFSLLCISLLCFFLWYYLRAASAPPRTSMVHGAGQRCWRPGLFVCAWWFSYSLLDCWFRCDRAILFVNLETARKTTKNHCPVCSDH